MAIIPRFCILFASKTRRIFISITIIATSDLKRAERNGENMTYAEHLSKFLDGTLNGGVSLGVNSSSSGDNRGRLKRP